MKTGADHARRLPIHAHSASLRLAHARHRDAAWPRSIPSTDGGRLLPAQPAFSPAPRAHIRATGSYAFPHTSRIRRLTRLRSAHCADGGAVDRTGAARHPRPAAPLRLPIETAVTHHVASRCGHGHSAARSLGGAVQAGGGEKPFAAGSMSRRAISDRPVPSRRQARRAAGRPALEPVSSSVPSSRPRAHTSRNARRRSATVATRPRRFYESGNGLAPVRLPLRPPGSFRRRRPK